LAHHNGANAGGGAILQKAIPFRQDELGVHNVSNERIASIDGKDLGAIAIPGLEDNFSAISRLVNPHPRDLSGGRMSGQGHHQRDRTATDNFGQTKMRFHHSLLLPTLKQANQSKQVSRLTRVLSQSPCVKTFANIR
jgi:hypothetical protein